MDPNIEDHVSERPLHYAALAGHEQAALALLRAGADPWAESRLSETPLEVAQQAPAAFLEVSCEKVLVALHDAQKAAPFTLLSEPSGASVNAVRAAMPATS